MAKVQIKSEKLTPFGGILSIMEKFGSVNRAVTQFSLHYPRMNVRGILFLLGVPVGRSGFPLQVLA